MNPIRISNVIILLSYIIILNVMLKTHTITVMEFKVFLIVLFVVLTQKHLSCPIWVTCGKCEFYMTIVELLQAGF